MAMYSCCRCDYYTDDDWFPCEEGGDHRPEWNGELICPNCVEEESDDLVSWRDGV
jgi:hypothetical protein